MMRNYELYIVYSVNATDENYSLLSYAIIAGILKQIGG